MICKNSNKNSFVKTFIYLCSKKLILLITFGGHRKNYPWPPL